MSVAEQHVLPLFAPRRMVPQAAMVPSDQPPAGAVENTGAAPAWRSRDYQGAGVLAIHNELVTKDLRSTLLVMATGLGKTFTASEFVRTWPGQVLWLAHRFELLDQARRELQELTGERVTLEQADSRGGGSRIIVGSVQTLKGERLHGRQVDGQQIGGWPKDRFSLIVIDEAHHAPAQSYRQIVAHFTAAKVLGLTATPDRLDGKAQGEVFQSVAFQRDIDFGIAEGYLVPVTLVDTWVESLNLASIKTVAGDLDKQAVEDEIVKAVAPIAKAVLDETKNGERSLTFTPRVGSAKAVTAALNEAQAESARCVDGKTEKDLREFTKRGHKAGRFPHLVNCSVFTEGYDDPGVRVGVIAKPTKSRALYVQMLGRILRPLPGLAELPTREERLAAIAASAKPSATIVDITGNAGKHRLVSPVDILGGRYTDDEKKRAKKILRKKNGEVGAALDQARKELIAEDQARQRAMAKRAAAAQVKLKQRRFDPFSILGVHDEPGEIHPAWFFDPMTTQQADELKAFGVDIPDSCNYGQAKKLLSNARMRKQRGLSSYKQIRFLQRRGINAQRMYRSTAGRLFEAFKANGWKDLAPEVVQKIIGRGREPGEDDG